MTDTKTMDKPSQLQAELRKLSSRDWQLWSITAVVLTVVVLGFVALLAPTLLSTTVSSRTATRTLPILAAGLVVVIILFDIYVFDQRRRLNSMREMLFRCVVSRDAVDELAGHDRLTDAYKRDYALAAIAREMRNVGGAPYTLVMIDIAGFRRVNSEFGSAAGDHLLRVASHIIRSSVRGSDVVARFGGDEFLVILPNTIPELATPPVARIHRAAAEWRRTTVVPYALEFRVAVAAGPTSGSADAILERLMEQTKGKIEPQRETESAMRLAEAVGRQIETAFTAQHSGRRRSSNSRIIAFHRKHQSA